ncbi:unnamed protein product [Echinostoma caproni]|uniref:Protein kinase domain-containing protein n=1 Tax=Echinostoma caproni TaxID=27848 RepID=A0A183AZU1_9TREM|nr:unnamed protein product [Echinostoma caproni]
MSFVPFLRRNSFVSRNHRLVCLVTLLLRHTTLGCVYNCRNTRSVLRIQMDAYSVTEQIAENTTTTVYKATRNTDGLPVIIKVFHLNALNPHHLRQFTCPYTSVSKNAPSEIIILEKVKQIPSCVTMIEYIDDSENGKWAVVLEDLYAQGYSNLAREIELISVLEQLHNLGILHCDIKPDNVFVDHERQKIKLIDFNLAVELTDPVNGATPGCTPEYAPPEVLVHRKPWTIAGEIWSVGCTAFVLLCRRFPFENPWMSGYSKRNVRSGFGNALQRGILFDGALRTVNGGLSPKAKDFLLLCLSRLPEQRPTLKHLSQHSFLALKAPSLCTVSNSIVLSNSPRTVLVS